jgi:hypothetical protein
LHCRWQLDAHPMTQFSGWKNVIEFDYVAAANQNPFTTIDGKAFTVVNTGATSARQIINGTGLVVTHAAGATVWEHDTYTGYGESILVESLYPSLAAAFPAKKWRAMCNYSTTNINEANEFLKFGFKLSGNASERNHALIQVGADGASAGPNKMGPQSCTGLPGLGPPVTVSANRLDGYAAHDVLVAEMELPFTWRVGIGSMTSGGTRWPKDREITWLGGGGQMFYPNVGGNTYGADSNVFNFNTSRGASGMRPMVLFAMASGGSATAFTVTRKKFRLQEWA